MGRAGIEPATLGLKVHPRKLLRTAPDGICLQVSAFSTATNCSELHPTETGRYAHRTLRLPAQPLSHGTKQPLGKLLAGLLSRTLSTCSECGTIIEIERACRYYSDGAGELLPFCSTCATREFGAGDGAAPGPTKR